MSAPQPDTIAGAVARLLWEPHTTPRVRWAYLVAVFSLKALNLSKALHRLAQHIAPGVPL